MAAPTPQREATDYSAGGSTGWGHVCYRKIQQCAISKKTEFGSFTEIETRKAKAKVLADLSVFSGLLSAARVAPVEGRRRTFSQPEALVPRGIEALRTSSPLKGHAFTYY